MNAIATAVGPDPEPAIKPPFWLLAELTYRCPLHCPFCYNPVNFAKIKAELTTDDWIRVLNEAREIGSVQCGFSGGEPLGRDDLEILIREAHRLGYYTNLLTSGVGLTEKRIAEFKAGGLDHIQLSFQDTTKQTNDFLSSTRTFDLKRKAAELIHKYDFEMVMNCVVHRLNIDHIDKIIEFALDIGAGYLELANAQYYSWALMNVDQLLPTREQVQRAEAVTQEYRQRIGNRMRLLFVVPDYYETRPKRCVNGWGTTLFAVTPDGTAVPCHTARMLPGLKFPNVRELSVHDIWYRSEGFNRFRGTRWMKEPCRSCDERFTCLGGCRCQAYMLTKDAYAADPVCDKSPHHRVVTAMVDRANRPRDPAAPAKPLVFRGAEESLAHTPTN